LDIKSKFVEVAVGSPGNRGKLMQLSQLHEFIANPENLKREIYYSWYCFDINLKNHFDKTFDDEIQRSTIQGYNGVYDINQIILDFDKKEKSDQELLDLMRCFISDEIVENYSIPDDYYSIWFSGTGYHFHLANCFGLIADVRLPAIVKRTMSELFPYADNIYDGHRIIRAGGTLNNKNKERPLYKTKIDREDLFKFSPEDIFEYSEKRRNDDFGLWFDTDIEVENILSEFVKKPTVSTMPVSAKKIRSRHNPGSVVTCMQTAYKAGPIKGQRNETMMRMVSWMYRNGMPKDVCYLGMVNWAGKSMEKEVETCVKSIYRDGMYIYGCNDPIMSEWCNEKCIYFTRKDYALNVKSMKEIEKDYSTWLEQDFKESSFNLADIWTLNKNFMFYPGELTIISGNTGLGKTAFMQNLCVRLPHMSTLFLSLEVQDRMLGRRFFQITHAKTKAEVDAIEADPLMRNSLYGECKQVRVLDESPEIKRLERLAAEMKPKIMIVDTTDCIEVANVYNEFEKMNTIIKTLKSIAMNQEIIVFGVHHTNKEGHKEGFTEIHHLKGSSTVSQKADKVLTISGEPEKNIRYVKTEKARDEGTIKMKFEFQPKTFAWVQQI
jgi:archaellum biogenesis ATPase FlaH